MALSPVSLAGFYTPLRFSLYPHKYDEFADVEAIAATAGLPAGWVFNAVKSRLLGVVFPDDRWDAEIDSKDRSTVRVSPTFGLNHLFDE